MIPPKIDSGFLQVPNQIFFWTENLGSDQDLLSILFRILTRIIERFRSRFSQVLLKISSESCPDFDLFLWCWSFLDFLTILQGSVQKQAAVWILTESACMIKILRRKYKNSLKILAGLCLECIQNLIFGILPRFITDLVQDPSKICTSENHNRISILESNKIWTIINW